MTHLLDKLLHNLAAEMRQGKTPPPPVEYNTTVYPYGAVAGHNKGRFIECATCGRPPTEEGNMKFHLFKDMLSAQEYRLSGMCQACQDDIFHPWPDEEA